LRGGTTVGSPTNLDDGDDERDDERSDNRVVEHARRAYSHPQDRLVWRISKVGLPILLKLRAELGHLGRFGRHLIPASRELGRRTLSQNEIIAKCWPTCASRSVSWSFQIPRPQLRYHGQSQSTRKYLSNEGGRHTINCSFLVAEYRIQRLRLICSKDLMKRRLWSAYAPNVSKDQKWSLHGKTLIILANSRQVNTLLHPDTLEHVLGTDARTLQNTRRTKCPR
jgi:hypothetical protein